MRKKIVHILLGSALVVMLEGCGQKKEEGVVTLTPAVDPAAQTTTAAPAAGEETASGEETSEPAETPDASDATATPGASETAELLSQEYKVCFANLTGRDIVKLQITFSGSGIENLEVLGEKRLYDGEEYTYQSSNLDGLRGATRLKMSVTATAKDATVMLFPEIDVLDPAHTDVILTSSAEGWRMYLQ